MLSLLSLPYLACQYWVTMLGYYCVLALVWVKEWISVSVADWLAALETLKVSLGDLTSGFFVKWARFVARGLVSNLDALGGRLRE